MAGVVGKELRNSTGRVLLASLLQIKFHRFGGKKTFGFLQ